jgi:hypothetical protein
MSQRAGPAFAAAPQRTVRRLLLLLPLLRDLVAFA